MENQISLRCRILDFFWLSLVVFVIVILAHQSLIWAATNTCLQVVSLSDWASSRSATAAAAEPEPSASSFQGVVRNFTGKPWENVRTHVMNRCKWNINVYNVVWFLSACPTTKIDPAWPPLRRSTKTSKVQPADGQILDDLDATLNLVMRFKVIEWHV